MTLYARVTKPNSSLFVCGNGLHLDEHGNPLPTYVSEPCGGCGQQCSTVTPCPCCAEREAGLG